MTSALHLLLLSFTLLLVHLYAAGGDSKDTQLHSTLMNAFEQLKYIKDRFYISQYKVQFTQTDLDEMRNDMEKLDGLVTDLVRATAIRGVQDEWDTMMSSELISSFARISGEFPNTPVAQTIKPEVKDMEDLVGLTDAFISFKEGNYKKAKDALERLTSDEDVMLRLSNGIKAAGAGWRDFFANLEDVTSSEDLWGPDVPATMTNLEAESRAIGSSLYTITKDIGVLPAKLAKLAPIVSKLATGLEREDIARRRNVLKKRLEKLEKAKRAESIDDTLDKVEKVYRPGRAYGRDNSMERANRAESIARFIDQLDGAISGIDDIFWANKRLHCAFIAKFYAELDAQIGKSGRSSARTERRDPQFQAANAKQGGYYGKALKDKKRQKRKAGKAKKGKKMSRN